MMAEIEYFVHPNKKQNHNKFSSVSQLVVTLFSSGNQMSGEPAAPLSLGDAVKQVSWSFTVAFVTVVLSGINS